MRVPRLGSIRHKLLAAVFLTTLSALLLAIAVLMGFDLRSYRELIGNELKTQARLIGHLSAAALRSGDAEAARANLALLQVRPGVRAAAIYDSSGALFASYVRDGGHFGFPPRANSNALRDTGTSMTVLEPIEANGEVRGGVYLFAEYGMQRRRESYAAVAAVATAGALVLSLVLSLWLQKLLTRPIQDISELAREVVANRDYSLRANKSSEDEIGTLAAAFNDMLVEIERRAKAMFESEARYRSLVEATAQIIWVADSDGKVAAPVPSWQGYTGQSDAEVLGDGWALALHPEDQAAALTAWRAAVADESIYAYAYRVRRRDGEYRWFAVRGVPVRREDGSIKEWVRVCFDINDRRRAEQDARSLREELEARVRERTAQLEAANRELEAFSYSVSHDLRAPLRAMDGFSQALLEDYADVADDGMRRYLERIRSATVHMGQLIDDLLDLSRISRVELQHTEVDLGALVRQVAKEIQQREPARKVDLIVWDDVVARGDPRLLRVAIENLLGNAWKFTGKAAQPRIEFGALHEATRTVYFVRDNGAGFNMAHAEKLFGAFHRLHAAAEFPGTGIGLATVQRVIRRHGGHIWAHAKVGHGATFFFTLEHGAQQPAVQEQLA